MISLLNLEELTPQKYILSIISYFLIHTTLFSILVTQYYTKILEHIILSFNIINIYKNALIHTFVINLPRLYFLMKSDIYSSRSTMTGFNALNLSLGFGLILLNTHSKSFINLNSFFKDMMCLIISVISQAICLQENFYPNFLIYFSLGIFTIFFLYTLKMKDTNRQEIQPIPTSSENFKLLKKINKISTKYFYNILILDLENFNKQSFLASVKIFFSPVINSGLLIWYFQILKNTQDILIAICMSLLFGLILVKCFKNQNLQIFNYFYGLSVTILYSIIFIDRVFKLVQTISSTGNINLNYLNSIFTAGILGLPEILNLVYYSKLNKSSQAACSLLYSVILNSLSLVPIKKLFNMESIDTKYDGDRVGLSIFSISIIVSLFNYIMKNQKLSKDLGLNLIVIYLIYNLTYVLDYSMFIKNSIVRLVFRLFSIN